MPSKWERELVAHLTLASQAVDASARWPYPAPVAQYRPDWCCAHPRPKHVYSGDGARAVGLTDYCRPCEDWHAFHHGRKWAIDAAYPDLKLGVEYEGIVWAKKGEQVGRHQTGAGMTADLEKYNWLIEHGWQVVRVSQRDVSSGYALTVVQAALRQATPNPPSATATASESAHLPSGG